MKTRPSSLTITSILAMTLVLGCFEDPLAMMDGQASGETDESETGLETSGGMDEMSPETGEEETGEAETETETETGEEETETETGEEETGEEETGEEEPACGDGIVQEGFEECDDGNGTLGDGCTDECLLECGTDCWGPEGCKTEGGRCIRFSCRLDTDGADFCDSCMGWNEITYEQWLGDGYCEDVIAKFRTEYGHATACGGGVASCCGDQASCAGDFRAWNFRSGDTMYYTGPCLNCDTEPDNCTHWNEPILAPGGTHSRISACERY